MTPLEEMGRFKTDVAWNPMRPKRTRIVKVQYVLMGRRKPLPYKIEKGVYDHEC